MLKHALRGPVTAEECLAIVDKGRCTVGPRPSHVIAEPPDGWHIIQIRQRKRWGDMHTNVYSTCPIDPKWGRLLTVCLESDDGDSEVMHQVWKDDQGWIEIPPGQRERAPLPTRPDEPSLRFDTQHEDGEGL